jgi:hypothetical protein
MPLLSEKKVGEICENTDKTMHMIALCRRNT